MEGLRTRRRFLRDGAAAGLTIGSFGSVAAACGSSDKSSTTKQGAPSGDITYLKTPNLATDAQVQKQLAAEFHRTRPQITVHPSIFDVTSADTKLTTAYAGNHPPDIAAMQNTTWAKFAAAGALLDLTDRVKSAEFASEFAKYPQSAWDGVTYDGKIYGVPVLQGSISELWVNRDLMEKAGVDDYSSSYDAIREAAQRTRKGNVFGYGMTTTMPGYAYQSWINYIYNGGGDLLNEDASAGGLDHQGVVAGFDFLRTLHYEDKVTPPPGAYDFPQIAALFQAGRLAILHLDGEISYITGIGGKKPIKFDFDAFSLPAGPGGRWTPVFRQSLHISSRSGSPDAAWEYVKWLTSAKESTRYLRMTDQQPVRTDTVDQVFPTDDRKDELQRQFLGDAIKAGRVFKPHPRTLDFLQSVQTEFEKLIRGKQTGAELVQHANSAITQAVSS